MIIIVMTSLLLLFYVCFRYSIVFITIFYPSKRLWSNVYVVFDLYFVHVFCIIMLPRNLLRKKRRVETSLLILFSREIYMEICLKLYFTNFYYFYSMSVFGSLG